MKRAILYVAYGNKFLEFIHKAIQSPQFPEYPIYLLTDKRTPIESSDLFHEILRIDFELEGHLRKSELVKILPDEEITFLYLDTDTIILDDVSLGFEKAEQYGMAVTQAPVYSMDNYELFQDIMRAEGVEPKGNLMYNAGVIFFHLNSTTRAVLNEYHDLCDKYKTETDNDQFLLNVVFEKLSFNPYTLSPSYNYRALGELLSGNVRIWHSWHDVPKNINSRTIPFAWRSKNGRIVRHFLRPQSMMTRLKWKLKNLMAD